MFERYAVFYTASGAFAQFGAAWLGWDSAVGQTLTFPGQPDLDIARLTARPRKYGFHATLKAPFHLARGQSLDCLQDALNGFAQRRAPVTLGAVEVSATHGFIALRPNTASVALNNLAAAVVRDFDMFRAPLTPEDIARRRKARLSPRQDQQMLEWGYPFVFDDFHFHMTLTGPVRRDDMGAVLAQVEKLFAPVLPDPLVVDAVTLMGQDAQGMFHQIQRAALVG